MRSIANVKFHLYKIVITFCILRLELFSSYCKVLYPLRYIIWLLHLLWQRRAQAVFLTAATYKGLSKLTLKPNFLQVLLVLSTLQLAQN